jgi:hypothetical protein
LTLPTGETHGFLGLEDLLRHGREFHTWGQAAVGIGRKKRKRDGDDGPDDAARATIRKKAGNHRLAYKEEFSPGAVYGARSDTLVDVAAACTSTVDAKQTCRSPEDNMRPSVNLDAGSQGLVDPALLCL